MLIALLVVGVITAWRLSREDDPVAEASSLLGQERRFDSSREAVESFASAYHHLVAATQQFPKDCEVEEGRGRCLGLNQAASWSLNFATASAGCTQPTIQEGRITLLRYVRSTASLDDEAREPPPLPPLPPC